MKKVTLFAATAVLFLACSGDKITKEKFCGKKWYLTKMEAGGKSQEIKDDKKYITFLTDGTAVATTGEFADSSKYDFDEATKTISTKGKDGTVNQKMEITKLDDKHMDVKNTVVAMGMTINMSMEAR